MVGDLPGGDAHLRGGVEGHHAEGVLRPHPINQRVQSLFNRRQPGALHGPRVVNDGHQGLHWPICKILWDGRLKGQQAGEIVLTLQGDYMEIEPCFDVHWSPCFRSYAITKSEYSCFHDYVEVTGRRSNASGAGRLREVHRGSTGQELTASSKERP